MGTSVQARAASVQTREASVQTRAASECQRTPRQRTASTGLLEGCTFQWGQAAYVEKLLTFGRKPRYIESNGHSAGVTG